MARRNRTRFTVLACLTVEPMSGYDIRQFMEQTVTHFWSESYGQIYPTLKALEAEGLVRGRNEPPDRGGHPRRVYALTDSGLDEVRRWLRKPPEPDVPRYELSLKLFFGNQLSLEDTRALLELHRKRHADTLEHYRVSEQRLREQLEGSSRLPFRLAVLRGGIRYSAMVVEWCDETTAALSALDPSGFPAEPSAPVLGRADGEPIRDGD